GLGAGLFGGQVELIAVQLLNRPPTKTPKDILRHQSPELSRIIGFFPRTMTRSVRRGRTAFVTASHILGHTVGHTRGEQWQGVGRRRSESTSACSSRPAG